MLRSAPERPVLKPLASTSFSVSLAPEDSPELALPLPCSQTSSGSRMAPNKSQRLNLRYQAHRVGLQQLDSPIICRTDSKTKGDIYPM